MSEKGGTGTAEYRAFKACTPQLVSAIKGDLSLADKLLAEGLISDGLYEDTHSEFLVERTKAKKIVTSVREKIKCIKTNFNVFRDILEDNPIYFKDLLTKLENEKMSAIEQDRTKPLIHFSTRSVLYTCAVLVVVLSLLYYHQPQGKLLLLLKGHYKQLPEIDLDEYLPQNMEGCEIPFIVPNILPASGYDTSPVTVKELLDTVQAGTKLAITGRPGVGKSTFARHIAKLWAQKKVLTQFNALFHICLGRTASIITDFRSLLEGECHGLVTDDPELELEKFLKQVKDSEGAGIVFVLDAFDKYPSSFSEHQWNDYVFKLIKNASLPNSALIVTSRRRRIDDVKNYFSDIVEITGFNNTNIDLSLYYLGPPLGQLISQYFERNPNVKEMCYLPLHMTMIIYLSCLEENNLSLIDTETEIYTDFLYLTVTHYNAKRHEWSASSLDVCFEQPDFESDLCRVFKKVCELAFRGVLNQQQTFNSSEISKLPLAPDNLEALSLFNIKKAKSRRGSIDIYYFSHQTFQEFMAACHLFMSIEEKQKETITQYFSENLTLSDLIWKFLFGLVGQKNNETVLFDLFSTFVSSAGYTQLLGSQYFTIDFYPLLYAYETGKRHEEFATLLDFANITGIGNNYSLHIHIHEPMDLRSLLNFGGSSEAAFVFLKYALQWIPITVLKMELQVRYTHPDPRLCTKEYLNITINQTVGEFQDVFTEYCSDENRINITKTIVLELEYLTNQFDLDPSVLIQILRSAVLTDELRASSLHLQLIREMIKANETQVRPHLIFDVLDRMQNNTIVTSDDLNEKELKYLQLIYPLDKYKYRMANPALQSLKSLKFPKLKSLKLQHLLMDIDIKPLCASLKSAQSLEVLDLSNNNLAHPKPLTEVISHLKKLRKLDLSDNFVTDQWMGEFSTKFGFLKDLRVLNLSGNVFNSVPKGFATRLEHLKKLHSLDLSNTGCAWGHELALGIQNLKHLNFVNISHCLISSKHFYELAKSLHRLPNLMKLDLSHNLIGELSTTWRIVFGFIQLSHVKELDLSHNHIELPPEELVDVLTKPGRVNLSHNLICVDELSLQHFVKFKRRRISIELDLSHNILLLGEKFNRKGSHRIIYSSLSHNIIIKLSGSEVIKDEDLPRHANICRWFPHILFKNPLYLQLTYHGLPMKEDEEFLTVRIKNQLKRIGNDWTKSIQQLNVKIFKKWEHHSMAKRLKQNLLLAEEHAQITE